VIHQELQIDDEQLTLPCDARGNPLGG